MVYSYFTGMTTSNQSLEPSVDAFVHTACHVTHQSASSLS